MSFCLFQSNTCLCKGRFYISLKVSNVYEEYIRCSRVGFFIDLSCICKIGMDGGAHSVIRKARAMVPRSYIYVDSFVFHPLIYRILFSSYGVRCKLSYGLGEGRDSFKIRFKDISTSTCGSSIIERNYYLNDFFIKSNEKSFRFLEALKKLLKLLKWRWRRKS